jgi:hypothetical protein
MPTMLPFQVEPLPGDDRFWRVDYFGHPAANSAVPSEFDMEVALSPLLSCFSAGGVHEVDLLSSAAVDLDAQVVCRVQSSFLPLFSVGGLWQRKMPAIHSAKLKTYTVRLSGRAARIIGFREPIPDPFGLSSEMPIPSCHYEMGPKAHPRAMCSNLVSVPTESGLIHEVLIPSFELARFYLCVQRTLTQELFYGCEIAWKFDPLCEGIRV